MKLRDFDEGGGAALTALTRPLAFAPAKDAPICESCVQAQDRIAGMEERHAAYLTAQRETLEAEFAAELRALEERLDTNLHTGLAQCLDALFPALAQASLSQALQAELRKAITETAPEQIEVRVSAALSGTLDLPADMRATTDATLAGHSVEIRHGAARTRLDPDAILKTCLAHLDGTIDKKATA